MEHAATTLLAGSDLQLCTFERLGAELPCLPNDALIRRRLPTGYVSSIQMTVQAVPKPPSTFVLLGTALPLLLESWSLSQVENRWPL